MEPAPAPGAGGARTLAKRAAALLLIAVAGYYAVWGGEYSALDLRSLRLQQEVERERLDGLRAEIDSLRQLVDGLENDPAAIEAVARERFGLIRPGEVLYRFISVDSVPGDEAEATMEGDLPTPP